MKIKYLGTGAAEGVPAMFCNCSVCSNIRSLGESEFRTRSQILINDDLSVDFPPEAYAHSLRFGVDLSRIKYLLATHSHMDHFYAHDFILRGYKYATVMAEDVLNIYGNREVAAVFSECTAREMKECVAPHIKVNILKPYCEYKIGNYRVITLPANHSKTEDALLFYIEQNGKGYLHFYDTGVVSDSVFQFLKECGAKVNLVSFDCTFINHTGGEGARHMGIEDDMFMKRKLLEYGICDNCTKYYVTHFSHNSNPLRANLRLIEQKYGVTAAYDGLEVVIE